jgi:hypothetical protein
MPKPKPEPVYVTTQKAVELSGYHPVTLRVLLGAGKVKGKKWGQVWQVDKNSLLAYMRQQEQRGARRGPKPRT